MGRPARAVLVVLAALLMAAACGLATGAAPKGSVNAVLGLGLGVDMGVLLGGTINGKWAAPAQITRRLHGGESYRFYGRGKSEGVARGSAPKKGRDLPVEGNYLVALRPQPKVKEPSVAISGTWNALPRPVHVQRAYRQAWLDAVRAVLVRKGIAHPVVEIRSATGADLDGDGVEEVVLTAAHSSSDDVWEDPRRGDYSLVMVHKPAPRGPRSVVLAATYPESSDGGLDGLGMRRFHAPLLLDLDGNGTMEVVVPFDYYEGLGVDAYVVKGPTAKRLFEAMVGT